MGSLRLALFGSAILLGLLVGSGESQRCRPKGTTCSEIRPGSVTKKYASCPGTDEVMLGCVSRGKSGCIATDCMSKSSLKGNAQCGTVTANDSSSDSAHSINVFQESCALKSEERVVCCQPNSQESVLLAGYGAEPHEFPHQVLLIPKRKVGESPGRFVLSACGATIYNEKWILTAAHCVVDEDVHPTYKNPDPKNPLKFSTPMEGKQLEVVVGSNIPGTAPASHRYQVKRVIVHERYSALKKNQDDAIAKKKDPTVTLYDMAVLELESEIEFNEDTMAIKIAPAFFRPEQHSDKLMIIGWGTTDNGETAEFLQKGDLVIRDKKKCKKPYGTSFIPSQHLCIGGYVDGVYGKTAGEGDSGGPAICRDAEGEAVLCGITSFGGEDDLCSQSPSQQTCTPSVYADVSYFRNWIVKNAGEQDTGKTKFMETPLYGIEAGNELSQVEVRISDEKTCGGTLVAPDVVVTAAHCGFEENGVSKSGVVVVFNEVEYQVVSAELLTLSGKAQLERKNEDFRGKFKEFNGLTVIEDPYYASDVAVLKLDSKVSDARVAVLSSVRLTEAEGNVYEASWMRDTVTDLRKFPVNVVGKENCEDVCMVEKYSGGSSCDREVGGGVFCGDKLCGVQVFRMCDFSAPGIITDISHLTSAIQATIKS